MAAHSASCVAACGLLVALLLSPPVPATTVRGPCTTLFLVFVGQNPEASVVNSACGSQVSWVGTKSNAATLTYSVATPRGTTTCTWPAATPASGMTCTGPAEAVAASSSLDVHAGHPTTMFGSVSISMTLAGRCAESCFAAYSFVH